MAVVSICYKMPHRNQTQHIQNLMRQNERGMMITCDSVKLFSVYIYKKWSSSSNIKGPILLQTRSGFQHNLRSISETKSHVGIFCANQKQLRSLSSYFGKLQDANKLKLLNPAESSNKPLSETQLCSNKKLDILGAYLDKLDKDESSADKDCSTAAEPTLSSFECQHTIKEDYERKEDMKMRTYMNKGTRIGSHGPKEYQRLQQDDGDDEDEDEPSDLYLISTLASINIAVVLFEIASPIRSSDMELSSLPLLYGAKVNHLILVGEWWRLITPMFLNCGVFDIGLGCWALFTFGPKVCRGYGSFTFLLIYILGGISGNLISFLHTPKPTIGGTAPIYAIIGAWMVYQIQNKDVISKQVSENLFQKAIIITGLGFILSHFVPIDEWAHFGAAFSGVAYGFVACPTLELDDITASASSSSGQEKGIALVKRQSDPWKSLLCGRGVRDLLGPLIVANLVVHLIVLGLAGWSLDKYIDGEENHPHLGGNPSTRFMLVFALVGGVVGACSLISGLIHLRTWRSDSLAAASSLALIAWALTALAFGLVCKEMILGGRRGKRLQTLEAFIVISLLSQILYVVLLHGGVYSSTYGPGYRNDPQKPATSADI
ncbi:hypothetical protein F8388_015336 [Cannabis sativa]|uniref:Peptidase S54 rhomboid domain-containing protein n=1 Tax=Cannabis sativa TaxID=3483 RepID=A0A7J6GI37_CANSA|nr:hypothetical protein F8388_015336 [Cannabis sativa]